MSDPVIVPDRPPRRRVRHPGGGRLLVVESDALDSDINSIMDKWLNYGVMRVPQVPPKFGDFSDAVSFHEALTRLHEAQREFDALPAHIRAHVDNDVAGFLDMVYDPERRKELVELGLVEEAMPVVPPAGPGPSPAEPAGPVAEGAEDGQRGAGEAAPDAS